MPAFSEQQWKTVSDFFLAVPLATLFKVGVGRVRIEQAHCHLLARVLEILVSSDSFGPSQLPKPGLASSTSEVAAVLSPSPDQPEAARKLFLGDSVIRTYFPTTAVAESGSAH